MDEKLKAWLLTAPPSVSAFDLMCMAWEESARLEREQVVRLRELAATVYAGLGAECNLPERWLDVLSAAANGDPFDTEDLLPFTYEAPTPREVQG